MRVFNPRKIRWARIIDSVGRFVFHLFMGKAASGFTPLPQLTPSRILVLESHLIGDIVMAIPALRALRDRFPSSSITLVAGSWGRELLENQKLVDDFIVIRFPWSTYDYSFSNVKLMLSALFKTRKRPWDLGIDLRGDVRNILFLYLTKATRRVSYNFTGGEYLLTDVIHDASYLKHVIDYNSYLIEQIGCHVTSKEPALLVAKNQIDDARDFLRLEGITNENNIIGIHPGASKPLRHWKDDRFAKLADLLLEDQKNRVLLFQGPQDAGVVERIISLMKYSPVVISRPLHQLPAILKCCDVVIGLDSGAVHVAAAVGVPTIVLFGPAEPERVKPFSDKTVVIIKEGYWCRPCDQVNCVQPNNNCMDALQVDSVYLSTMDLIKKKSVVRNQNSRELQENDSAL